MHKTLFLLIPWLLCCLGFSGCALMAEGPQQKIQLQCVPPDDVTMTLNGREVMAPEGLLTLSKARDTHFLRIEKQGYYPVTLSFDRSINPLWAAENLIWLPGYPLAMLVDWASNSIYQITPRDVHVVLRRKEE